MQISCCSLPPFPKQGCVFTARISDPLLKTNKHLFGFDYVYRSKISFLMYSFLSAHIRSTHTESGCHTACEYYSRWPNGWSVGLETRGNPRLWVRIPAPTGSPRLLPGRCTVGCLLLQVCTLGWVKCREHISLLIILCIIVYVTNKAHLSLICILLYIVLN